MSHHGLSQIPAPRSCTSTSRALDKWRSGRARLEVPRPSGSVADPIAKVVALSGDYDFQFLIEEWPWGPTYKLPYFMSW